MSGFHNYLVLFVILICQTDAFYIPSLSPKTFRPGDRVPLEVNRVFSEHVPLPFAYYDLPFVCKPASINYPWLNIGEVLRGDRIASSDYELYMGKNSTCNVLCTREIDAKANEEAGWFVEQDYLIEWIVDKLPAATVYRRLQDTQNPVSYEPGFRIGDFDAAAKRAFLNNHVSLHILYERHREGRRIVGVEAYPRSIENSSGECPDLSDASQDRLVVGQKQPRKVTFSYSVHWIEDPSVRWTHRWDRYIRTSSQVHWYAIFNSAVIILLLSGVVAVILMRMLNRDVSHSSREIEEFRDEIEETSGWKLLHGDVFRTPQWKGILAPVLGTTVQVMYTAISTVALGTLGILSPSYRGGLLTTGIVMFMLMGAAAGYYSGHLYRTWGGRNWLQNSLTTALAVPMLLFGIEMLLNMFLWYRSSSAAMPLSTILLLFVLWAAIELPLTVLGGWIGFRRKPYSEPMRTNAIPRPIPPLPRYLKLPLSILLAGALPLSVIFIEMFFVLKSIWQDAFYYEYGFMVIIGVLLAITVCETTIIMVWLLLNSGHHRWWWRSFAYGASSSIYFFIYSLACRTWRA
ncbi:hypothetical protein LPJ78_000059 [Coemansia sp. RSA 989]|nr:hypothetical protein LPJ78_000059 [Coemansia sp. RSA 989]